jgi:hypothetical protein
MSRNLNCTITVILKLDFNFKVEIYSDMIWISRQRELETLSHQCSYNHPVVDHIVPTDVLFTTSKRHEKSTKVSSQAQLTLKLTQQ